MTFGEALFWFYVALCVAGFTSAVVYFSAVGLRQFIKDARLGERRRRSEIPGVLS